MHMAELAPVQGPRQKATYTIRIYYQEAFFLFVHSMKFYSIFFKSTNQTTHNKMNYSGFLKMYVSLTILYMTCGKIFFSMDSQSI